MISRFKEVTCFVDVGFALGFLGLLLELAPKSHEIK